jgi:hypothetical protein
VLILVITICLPHIRRLTKSTEKFHHMIHIYGPAVALCWLFACQRHSAGMSRRQYKRDPREATSTTHVHMQYQLHSAVLIPRSSMRLWSLITAVVNIVMKISALAREYLPAINPRPWCRVLRRSTCWRDSSYRWLRTSPTRAHCTSGLCRRSTGAP